MRHLITVGIVALLATDARAEAPKPPPKKDPATAILLSVAGSALPFVVGSVVGSRQETAGWILGLGTAVLGPSAGHLYAGEMNWIGLAARAAAVGTLVWIFNAHEDCLIGDYDGQDRCTKYKQLFAGSLLAYAGGVLFDWATSGDSARRANRKHEAIQLAPTVIKGPVSKGAGVGLRVSF